MTKKWAACFSLLLALLLVFTSAAQAQSYLFHLTRYVVNFYVNEDGSTSLEYVFDFQNDPAGHAIEYVDVGLPNGNYDLDSVTASVDGKPIEDISRANPNDLVGASNGVTLALAEDSIPPGQFGRVQMSVGRINEMVFPGEDSDRPDYASFQFYPNYFGQDYVTGNTNMSVTLILPPGVQPDESVYYTPGGGWPGPAEPASGLDDQDRIFFTWETDQANASRQYTFGAGFPAQYVPASAITTPPSGGGIDLGFLICLGIGLLFGVVFIWGIIASFRGAGKRKLAYMPPKIAIEGHGIKRGLTAVEAAILQEQPLDKVLTMILFGVIKKGGATVVKREPLELEATVPRPEGLHPYEAAFVEAFTKQGAERRRDLQEMFVNLVQSVSEKMKGFSRKETQDYYSSIMDQAWAQVDAANTPEVKGQKFDEALEWTMLDRRFEDRTRDVFRGGTVFAPTWWPRYDPVFRGGGTGGSSTTPVSLPGSSPGGGFSMPNLPGSDFAASVVNSVSNFGAGVVGDLTSFTGGVTNKTNPVPKTTYTSSRGSGGGGGRSCACACACAGCACACAGGGR